MNAFIIELENKPGSLAQVAEALGERGINITAISGVTAGTAGALGVLTNDESGTREVLKSAGIKVREIGLVSVSLENKPGALGQVARKLADAGVNIELLLGTGMSGSNVTVALGVDNVEAAQRAIGQAASVQA
ncbi:MAG TPA: ACT domain-containing protein [Candidatus Limnocylindria bacterium]